MKLNTILFILLSVFFLNIHAQLPQADIIKTSEGDITIQPITHGTLVLTFNKTTIYVDPYGGADKFEGLSKPDYILITDIHGDHLNIETLKGIDTRGATFIVPQAVANELPSEYKSQVEILENRQGIHRMGMYISAVAMYNLPESEDSRHTKGRGNGYIINMGSKNIYISGDTEDIPEMRALYDIDVAFVCMNLPYTMDIDQASSAVLEFKPIIVYPYHYRGQDGLADVKKFKEIVNSGDSNIEVRLKDWYMN
ncbi:MBL fold metallo-hydrolase [Urechidicola croceus]|uniref:MBL fold metallo-hydrolase n=1 Tax=Urechidicola croceus TaxID=1850246 RepID=A0A1D8P727_9FLAO|nr:MBL fold metallo-hydrolase [Urechidicola croceus]AOW20367.1 MBL fold metallo-hydrolase [Urechidicola croceus]